MEEQKIDFVKYLPFDVLFVISTFLSMPDIIRLMSINKEYYLIFSQNRFWERIYRINSYIPKKHPLISDKFMIVNRKKFEYVLRSLYPQCIGEISNTTIKDTKISNISTNMLDNVNNFDHCVERIKSMHQFDELTDIRLKEYKKYVLSSTACVGRSFGRQNKLECIRKCAHKYMCVKILNLIIRRHRQNIEFINHHNGQKETIFFPKLNVFDNWKLDSSVINEICDNFIRRYKGCHIFTPVCLNRIYGYTKIRPQIFVFNHKQIKKSRDELIIFIQGTRELNIYQKRDKIVLQKSEILTPKTLNNYDVDDLTIEPDFEYY